MGRPDESACAPAPSLTRANEPSGWKCLRTCAPASPGLMSHPDESACAPGLPGKKPRTPGPSLPPPQAALPGPRGHLSGSTGVWPTSVAQEWSWVEILGSEAPLWETHPPLSPYFSANTSYFVSDLIPLPDTPTSSGWKRQENRCEVSHGREKSLRHTQFFGQVDSKENE